MKDHRLKTLRKLTLFNLIFCLGVILWGAFVRATGSGAGCGSHWPLCNGKVIPRAESVEVLIEYSHRLTSGLFLLTIVAALIYTFRHTVKGHVLRKAASVSLFFVLLEAGIGAGLVLLELVADDQSAARTYWVGAHLANTLLLVAVLTANWWLTSHETCWKKLFSGFTGKLFGFSLFMILVVASTGAIVALGDTLFPVNSLSEGIRQDFDPRSHFLIRLRVFHPIFAIFSGFVLSFYGYRLLKGYQNTNAADLGRWIITAVLVQIGAGFVNMVLLAPIWLQMFHLLLANGLWIILVLSGLERASQFKV